jgi:hypothetical protein
MHETRTQGVIERNIEIYTCSELNWEIITTLAPAISVLVGDRPESVTIITESGADFSRVVWIGFLINGNNIDLLLYPSCPLTIVQREQTSFHYLDNTQRDTFLHETQLIKGMLKSGYERVDFFSLVSPEEFSFSPLDTLLSKILRYGIDISSTLLKRFNIGNLEYALIFNSFSGAYTLISWDPDQQNIEYRVRIYQREEPISKEYTLKPTDIIYETIRALLEQQN